MVLGVSQGYAVLFVFVTLRCRCREARLLFPGKDEEIMVMASFFVYFSRFSLLLVLILLTDLSLSLSSKHLCACVCVFVCVCVRVFCFSVFDQAIFCTALELDFLSSRARAHVSAHTL